VQPTIGGSVYVKPQEIECEPTQFEGVSIKVLYQDKSKGEMTGLLKWEPGATLPMHKHPEIEQTYVIEGRSTTTTASVAPGNSSGDGSVRSTKHIPTRERSSSPYIASRTSFSTARDTPVIISRDWPVPGG
jgi:hypothetical protein